MRFPVVPTALVALLLPSLPLSAQQAHGPTWIPPRPVEAPAAFQAALEAGTRAPDGRPGPAYWQHRADYRIEAGLDPATGRLEGRGTITWTNGSPGALETLLLRVEQNVFAPGARRNRRAPVTGGVEIGAVRVDGEPVEVRHPGRGYQEALTLLALDLPGPVASGGTAEIDVEWAFTVPPAPTFRTGNLDGEVFAVAQWYPRLAVHDDVYGWDLTPYLGDGEFYLEYGDFDVRLTLPAGWLVGATGTLRNPEEVLPGPVRARLESAREARETVRVVGEEEVEAGTATRGGPGETLTWHFTAESVRDFAFATSDRYVWDARGMEGGGTAHALYRPRFQAWREAARYAAFTVERLSEWLAPYPYPQITITEGPVGGMEYPMVVFNPGTDSDRGLASVTIHEVAHQWFPMMVGSMEAKHAWMDEGFVSYWDELVAAELWGEAPPRWGENGSYLRVAGTEAEVPIMRHTDLASPYGARGLAAYTKPAVVLGALREVVGDEAFEAAFRDYADAWAWKHPQPWDFMNLVEARAGRDLDWFWRPLLFETRVLDHAVTVVESMDGRSRIVVEDRGGVVLPTPVRVFTADGEARDLTIPAERWLREAPRVELEVPVGAVRVELDPERAFPDVDRSNNVWIRP